ncbi:MAG: hypothetical protein AMXMBFR47_21320 [Planctomycetota bacterium]
MSAKRAPAGRRSVPDKSQAPGATQSAGERRTAEDHVQALIDKFAPAHTSLVAAMRRSLRKHLPTAHEIVYEYRAWFVISFSPSEHGYEGVLAIRGDADGVKLYLNQGRDLPDREKLLQGSGQVRFVDVETASTLARPAVARLIDEAIARNRVPFARAGRGPVVIRSVSARQQQQRKALVRSQSER